MPCYEDIKAFRGGPEYAAIRAEAAETDELYRELTGRAPADAPRLDERAHRDAMIERGEGRKDDTGKPPLHLIPPEFLYAIAEILDFGAKKYAPRNWEKGMNWSRCYRAALGHLFDWFARKGPDPETGKSHLWHAACCIMFLVCYEIRSSGTDDRP